MRKRFIIEKIYADDYALSIGVGRDWSFVEGPWALYGRLGRYLFTFWFKGRGERHTTSTLRSA